MAFQNVRVKEFGYIQTNDGFFLTILLMSAKSIRYALAWSML